MFDFLPEADVVPLRQAVLQQVVAQVRFNSQGILSTHGGVSAVHDALAERYPRLTAEQQMLLTATPGSGVSSTTVPQYRLQDLRGSWAVVLSPEHATIETTAYTTWSELRNRMSEVLTAVGEVATLRVRERIGLRYINHIQPNDDGSFAERVRADVLGLARDSGWRSQLAGTVGQSIANDDGTQLALRYGLAPEAPGAVAPYLIDIDCSNGEPVTYEADQSLSYFDELNDVAYRCFCWCMDDGYRKSLSVEQDAS